MPKPDHDTVLVVDFGAQYAQLIARRVREARVHSEIVSHTISADEIKKRRPSGLILSGGPASVEAEGAPLLDPGVLELEIPILGICYGAQLIAKQLGGRVERPSRSEAGRTHLEITASSVMFGGVPTSFDVWMSHTDAVASVPDGFFVTACTDGLPVAAFEDSERGIFALQFHPEVSHTQRGQDILKSFLFDVCDCRPTWTTTSIIQDSVREIREIVGKERVICGLSGGVDSAVAAALVHKAIGGQLTCVFVDTGLLRLDEGEQVVDAFRRRFNIDLIHLKEADRFFQALKDVSDPELKRKAIGASFIRVFEEAARQVEDARFLVQGTLYPDVIESGNQHAATIKSHHNVGGLPDDMQFILIEPLAGLFKDEVRAIGVELGLPEEIVWRQPFPGPGLAVRIIGKVDRERVDILQRADSILIEEIKKAGWYRKVWQSFAVLPVIKTVGVLGDERTYAYPIVIRAVTSDDAMTADWARLDYDLVQRISSRMIEEIPEINRVVLDCTAKPPGTIEWE